MTARTVEQHRQIHLQLGSPFKLKPLSQKGWQNTPDRCIDLTISFLSLDVLPNIHGMGKRWSSRFQLSIANESIVNKQEILKKFCASFGASQICALYMNVPLLNDDDFHVHALALRMHLYQKHETIPLDTPENIPSEFSSFKDRLQIRTEQAKSFILQDGTIEYSLWAKEVHKVSSSATKTIDLFALHMRHNSQSMNLLSALTVSIRENPSLKVNLYACKVLIRFHLAADNLFEAHDTVAFLLKHLFRTLTKREERCYVIDACKAIIQPWLKASRQAYTLKALFEPFCRVFSYLDRASKECYFDIYWHKFIADRWMGLNSIRREEFAALLQTDTFLELASRDAEDKLERERGAGHIVRSEEYRENLIIAKLRIYYFNLMEIFLHCNRADLAALILKDIIAKYLYNSQMVKEIDNKSKTLLFPNHLKAIMEYLTEEEAIKFSTQNARGW